MTKLLLLVTSGSLFSGGSRNSVATRVIVARRIFSRRGVIALISALNFFVRALILKAITPLRDIKQRSSHVRLEEAL